METQSIARGRRGLAAAAWTLATLAGLAAAPAKELPEYQHDVWTTADGLPQNSVTDLAQTDDGYLWLSTYGGLVRFDGVRFQVFDVASTPELASNSIVRLDKDRDGNLWMSHGDEGITRMRDGTFTTYSARDGLPASGGVWALEVDHEGRPWAGTSNGVSRLENGRFVSLTTRDGLPSDVVLALLEDRRGAMWIGTGGGLARHDDGGFTVYGTEDGLPSEVVTALFEDRDGQLWAGTDGGLARTEGERFAVVSTRVGVARSIMQDRSGHLWIGADGQLLRMAPTAPGETARDLFPERFDTYRAWAVVEDREGSVWVGTEGKGLVRFKEKPVVRYTTDDGLPGTSVLAVTEDGDDGLWLGSQFGELTHFRDGTFTAYRPPPGAPPLAWVLSLARDHEGGLWIGHSLLPPAPSLDPYLSLLKNGTYRTWTRHDGLPEAHVRCLYEDSAGRLWIGTQGEGLVLFEDGRITQYTTRDGLVNDDLRFLTEDHEGALWIGTRGGASRFFGGRFTNYTTAEGLSRGPVRAIHEDDDGVLWLGTYGGGLSRLKDGEITRYTMDDGLFDNVVSRILEDGRGRLWMLGNLGLYFASRQMLNDYAEGRVAAVECVSFGLAEGMVEGNGGFQPAGWRTADGKMWFPTIDGLVTIDAERFEINQVPPPVAIERLVADGVAQSLHGGVRLPPGQGDLEFHYTGLSLVAPEKVRFRYKLEGYDHDWIDAGTRREAYYTNISPGDYTFRVVAANNHAVWNRQGAALEITLAPHYYQTGWFQALGVALLVVAGFAAFQVTTRRMQARNRRMQAEIRQRRRAEAEQARLIAELATKNAELERFTYTVSHDLKAPLVTIKGFVGLLRRDAGRGDADRLESDLDHIGAATDQMARLLEELLNLSRVGRVVNPPRPVPLGELVRDAVESVAGLVAERRIEIRVEPDLPSVYGDRLRLGEVFQNLLENAVRHMGDAASPVIEVGARRQGGEDVVYVRDNGVGIDPQYHDKIFGLFERLDSHGEGTGVGLAIVKRIVEFHGGRIWVESEGLGHGATFCLTLPRP